MTDPAPVLVVTSDDDATADLVTERLYDRGVPAVRLDPADFLGAVSVMSARFGTAGLSGVVTTPSRELDLRRVRAVWWRRPTPYQAPASWTGQDAEFALAEARFGFGGVLAALDQPLWVNHPWHSRNAEYKPGQLVTAVRCGFTVPETLITNGLARAREFCAEYAPVVYKPLRHMIIEDDQGVAGMIWANTVDPDELDESVAATAHMFQARVDKVADVRVTVVGDQVFAVRIDNGRLDWRAHYPELTYTLIPCPPAVRQAITSYMRVYDLLFGAFDFALTSDNEWFFLECNPNGQWAWIAEQEHLVADALADLLQKGHPSP